MADTGLAMTPPIALFRVEDGFYIPSAFTRGPWTPDAQHGGPPAGLLAQLIADFAPDQGPAGHEMFLARTTVELLRPVPLTPLAPAIRLVRPGKKIQLIEASLWANGAPGETGATEVVRATGLRVRRASMEISARVIGVNSVVDARDRITSEPGSGSLPSLEFGSEGFHAEAVDLRFAKGNMLIAGPGTMWGRLKYPVIGPGPTSGAPLAVTIADFGNAVSSVVDMHEHSYINADLTVSLHREPIGEWICLDGVTRISELGIGQAMTALHDAHGPIGRAVATLLIEPR